MKKNFKRKNYVLFGAIGIAAVALSSVGFATWITGIQDNTTDPSQIAVTVDTVNNKTSYIEAALVESESISIGENNVASSGNGKLYVENTIAPDFNIQFSTFRVITSTNFSITSISASLKIYKGDAPSTAVKATETCGIYPVTIKSENDNEIATPKTYIKFDKASISVADLQLISKDDPKYIEGYNCYKLKDSTMSFSWGSLFGNVPPTTHYQNYVNGLTIEDKLEQVAEITKELTDMHDNFQDSTIKITFTLNGNFSA